MNEIERAARLAEESRYTVAMTGAGISTPSGIPDFRSRTGIWSKNSPIVASLPAFRINPKRFFDWARPLVKTMMNASPNPAHVALADMEKEGLLRCVITQNIDSLHLRAGSQRVYELHGHAREATCTRCYKVFPLEKEWAHFLEEGDENGTGSTNGYGITIRRGVPHCKCNGVLKPNVILFGEQLPRRVFNEARKEAMKAELVIVAGTSLQVAPASELPLLSLNKGARLIIVNMEPTYLDDSADVVIRDRVEAVLPQIAGAAISALRRKRYEEYAPGVIRDRVGQPATG